MAKRIPTTYKFRLQTRPFCTNTQPGALAAGTCLAAEPALPVNTPKDTAGFSRHMFNVGKSNRENKQLLGCGKGGMEGMAALF